MPPISAKRVIDLEIIDMGLEGNISPLLSNLSLLAKLSLQELTRLELAVDYFTGQIPVELGALSRLEILNLHLNFLERTIPATLSNCTAMRAISLIENRLSGEIPSESIKLAEAVLANEQHFW
ncbi:hypothetical protein OIU84_006726 [Salix udensis]|uniref:Uncharacterized protein n=1 Tax=Salix udensis TaxID=889485 RepID=A0AAD6JZ64_9ROSI|nr:hypothetical protein OIU84_006726 [Salix udensis]